MGTERGRQGKNKPTLKDDRAQNYGPRTSGPSPSSAGSNDGSGTRARANLPPETTAMRSAEPMVPELDEVRSPALPVPGVNEKLINTHDNFQARRDRGLKAVGKGE